MASTNLLQKHLLPILQKKSLHTKKFLKTTFSPLPLGFGHITANCPTKSTKLATKEQIQITTKRENEKAEESKKGLILLDLPKIIAPSR